MNAFPFSVGCCVCGGPGVGNARAAAAEWFGETQHVDPRVCAEYLARRAAEIDRREKALEGAGG